MHQVYSEDISTEQKSKLWDKISADFLETKMTQTEYSKLNGLKNDHLSYYVRRYKRSKTIKNNISNSSFIPVELSPSSLDNNYIITIDNISLQLPSSYSINQIILIIKELRTFNVNVTS